MKAGAALAGGLAVGLAKGAKDASRFQAEMTRISTQAGGTAKDVKVLSDQVLKLGTTTQQGPQVLAESLYHLKSVGMDNVSAMKALKESSDLAAVGHANLEETTNALAGAWRTGIKGATSFHEAVSTVNAIIGAGNMSMDQFNAAIGTGILPSAKTFGLSLKQVGAALALMTDEGIDSASAATRLRMSFSLLGAPSGAAEKQLKRIGLTGLNLADAMRGKDGLIGALSLLKKHLDDSGLSASKQSQLLSRAFGGGRSSSGILLMLNNLDVLEKKQEQVNHSTGRYDDSVKQQRKTAEAQWHLLTSNLEVMGIRVGTKVLPYVTSFVKYLATDAMPAAAQFGKAMGNLVPVGGLKKGFTEAKDLLGDFFKGLSGDAVVNVAIPRVDKAPMMSMPKSTSAQFGQQIHDAISGGIGNLDWGKLGSSLGKGLSSAIGWVGEHVADLTKKFAKIMASINWIDVGKAVGGQAIPFAIGFINNLFAPLFSLSFWKKHWLDTILAVLAVIPIGRVAGVLGKAFEHIPILRIFEPLLSGIGKLGGWIEKGFLKVVLKPLLKLGRAILSGIVRGFTEVFPQVAGKLSGFVDDMALNVVGYAGRLGAAGERLITGLRDGILRYGGKAGEWVGRIIGYILKPFTGAASWLVNRGPAIVTGLKDGIVTGAKSLGSWAYRVMGRPVVSAFTGAGSWLVTKGRAIVSGLKSGTTAAAKGIAGWSKLHVIDPVTGAFKSSGSWLYSRGRGIVSGLKAGTTAGAVRIAGWMNRTVITPITSAFKGAGGWLLSRGKSLLSGLKSGATSAAVGIAGWINRTAIKPVTGAFKSAGSWLKEAGGHLLSGLKDGVTGAIKGIGKWIKKNMIDPIVGSVKSWFGIKSPSRVFMGIGGHLVSGLVKGMAKTSGTAIAKKVFGSLPKALARIVKKGLVSVSQLPGKALKALSGLGSDILDTLGLGGGSGGGSAANQKLGMMAAALRGWTGAQWDALKSLWNGESGWNEKALNASSGAYGIPQSLPASKMASAGSDWKTNPATQIKWGLNYIHSVYGTPLNAYSKWLDRSPHWYAKGTGGAAPGMAWVGEKGAELAFFHGGEQILNHQDSMAFAKTNGIKLPGYASGTIQNAADRVRRDREKVEDAKDALSRAKRRHKGEAAAEKRLEAARKELKAAEIALSNAKRSAKTSISNSIKTGLEKTLATGTSSAIGSAIKSLATKLLNAGYDRTAKSVQKKGTKLQTLASKKADIHARIAEANQYATDQAGNLKDFMSISGTQATNVGDLIKQMGGTQKTATGFVKLTKSLKKRGASKELLAQLAEAGPGSQLATILGAKGVSTQDIAKLNKLSKSGSKLATSFGKDMADMMYDSGKNAGKGFLSGLKSQEKALGKQMASVAKDLVKAIKKALKIKSPSVVFRDEIGKNVVLGMAHGIDRHGHLVGAATQRLADTATGITMRRRYVPTAVGPAGPDQEEIWSRLAAALEASGQDVHVHFNDEKLRDLIDVQVKPKIKASEDRQAFRAKVGRR
ncbi:phage tail tape measure protein [Streptomyces sp. 1222.5]|uniref:phage tail tape measure protein n=1 Tax=Streptomyces sp. 1222.5 TaxID=1881026 RepID=UPI003EB73F17